MIFYSKMTTMLNEETQSLITMGFGNVFTQQVFMSIIADLQQSIINLDDDTALGRKQRIRMKAQLEVWEDMLEASRHMVAKINSSDESSMI